MSYDEDIAMEDALYPWLNTDSMADHNNIDCSDEMIYGIAPSECLDCGEELDILEPNEEKDEYCPSCWKNRNSGDK